MADEDKGPDLAAGVALSRLDEGVPLAGHVGEADVLLVRRGESVHALGAHCPHRGAAMADGLVANGTIRCPWHHASFALESGAPSAPSLDPLPCWRVERDGETVRVLERLEPSRVSSGSEARVADADAHPESIVIVGAGAAGEAAAETLRAHGYAGALTLVSDAAGLPLDRTNLSKGYLAGDMDEAKLALRPREFYESRDIALEDGSRVASIDRGAHEVILENGTRLPYAKLLLATGATARTLDVDGADDGRVHTLRTLEDARGIVETAVRARRAVVIGASFIGLEAAAALRGRDIEVSVVAPEAVPLARVLGDTLGAFVRELHASKGVDFRLESEVEAIDGDGVRLKGGETLAADLVVVGIGVTPDTALADAAGLDVDDGILVDARLHTSDPDILAAGDVARWPDPRGEGRVRIEHWQVAQRQGQCAARNLLGADEPFDDVPFFWSKHYDANIRYSGHAEDWERIDTEGDVERRDFAATFVGADGERRAMASVGRDRDNLAFAATLENVSGRG